MEKIAILVDSGSDISPELIAEMGIHVLPLKILYGDKVYSDGENIEPAGGLRAVSGGDSQDLHAKFRRSDGAGGSAARRRIHAPAGGVHLVGSIGNVSEHLHGAQERAGHRLPGNRHEEHLHRRRRTGAVRGAAGEGGRGV